VDNATRGAFEALEGSTLAALGGAGDGPGASPQRCALELLALHAIATGGG
jgi:hypothetical protein